MTLVVLQAAEWEHGLAESQRPSPEASDMQREEFIRNKYVRRKWIRPTGASRDQDGMVKSDRGESSQRETAAGTQTKIQQSSATKKEEAPLAAVAPTANLISFDDDAGHVPIAQPARAAANTLLDDMLTMNISANASTSADLLAFGFTEPSVQQGAASMANFSQSGSNTQGGTKDPFEDLFGLK
ncbi:hypothetical protein GUITHDRAFT_115703 [Guillardia theta CCMP2712]|uniref:Uncharacterized protein n=1 Tax=Guillardia theta (strain CCMP2712) TaxID=905079 RepID=L1IQQ9_GUITC|nr:hypothetical protein GUITHDRAFT_115703 [Guillardia theta CCMP2712]EKX38155.1 hypothetical protein GUITHDRAFT_115703 [Guillardia theta CCMP2712]|eukprot:XP_005825135.1 hypothetical protein GUITHDRAFT_115703 [Guillardia theta CCMP2712]